MSAASAEDALRALGHRADHRGRHVDLGFATTSHSGQGVTAGRVILHANTTTALDRRLAYLALSRGRDHGPVFTKDAASWDAPWTAVSDVIPDGLERPSAATRRWTQVSQRMRAWTRNDNCCPEVVAVITRPG
jgi:hypothetical protein